jgi:hypothetical protein
LEVKICDLVKVHAESLAENQILKPNLEFAPAIPRPSESVKKYDGALDKDIF